MDVTFTADNALQTHALAALRFPLLVSADGAAPVPVLRLLRTPCTSAETAAGTPADIFVTSSSRIVELHVQAWGDGTLSYAQTLRGTPGPAAPAAAVDDGAPSCASAGSGGTQAFVARIPASQAYPDWRVLQLRFASARGAAGGVCTVYDIRTAAAGTSVASAASPSTAEGARASGAAAAAAGSATSTVSAGVVNSPAAEHAAVPEPPAPEEDGFGVPSSSSYGTAAGDVAAAAAPPQAVGSQMQQLRELLQRAAAAVPPAGASVSAAAAASASSSSESASLRPSHGSASAAVPSAARANLGLAATLARSLLQAQLPPPPANAAATATAQAHPPSRGDGRDSWAATAWPAAPGLAPMGDGGGLSGPGPVAGGAGGGSGAQAAAAAGAAESPEGCVRPRDSLSSSPGAGLGQASPLPQQPHLRAGVAPAAAAVSGGSGGGFPPFPLPGFLPGPLAAAAAQLADVSARVRRIEEHLLGPMGRGPAGPGAGAGADRGMGLGVGQQQQPGRGEQQLHAELRSQPQQQGQLQGQGQERGQQQHQTPGQEQEEQQEQGRQVPTPTAATRAELPPLWAQLSNSDVDPPSALHPTSPSPHPPPQLPPNPPPNPPPPGPLVEQLLAVLPPLTAGMARLEAAVAQQSAALSELTRQVAEVQRRMDTADGGVPAAAEAAPVPALTLAPIGSG